MLIVSTKEFTIRDPRQIRRDRIDGGGLTARESAKVDRKQDQLSRNIYRQKHDGQATK